MFSAEIHDLASAVLHAARAKHVMIATAESCTGGLIAAALTAIPGSSDVLERGFVTYSNAAKIDLLGVDPSLISRDGAVSETVVRAMAVGAAARSRADLAVSVSGVAGPGGGSDAKPVGLVWFGLASDRGVRSLKCHFPGDRDAVRLAALRQGLTLLHDALATPTA